MVVEEEAAALFVAVDNVVAAGVPDQDAEFAVAGRRVALAAVAVAETVAAVAEAAAVVVCDVSTEGRMASELAPDTNLELCRCCRR